MNRSHVHMFSVAAARLEQEGANPKLVADLRTTAKNEAMRRVEGRDYSSEDEKRIGQQRTLLAMIPDSRAKDKFVSAMLQRAYDLMWDGQCLECDAISEFLPSALVEKMFTAWNSDQMGKEPRSAFYNGEFQI